MTLSRRRVGTGLARLVVLVVAALTVSSCSTSGEARFEHEFGINGLTSLPGRLDQSDRAPFAADGPYDRSGSSRGSTASAMRASHEIRAITRAGSDLAEHRRTPAGLNANGEGESCTNDPDNPTASATDPLDASQYDISEWSFEGRVGERIITPNFDVYTTAERRWLRSNAARFQEAALAHYQHSITDLPSPRRRLETFIFGDRAQWESFASDMMNGRSNAFLRIGRGGFSTRGRAVVYDIGIADTLAIASHEGWHQYTQATFRDRLPVWMEEGIATWMEGHRLRRHDPPTFHPWRNLERFDQLWDAWNTDRLWSLEELLETHPAQMLEDGNPARGLDYYAQVWALAHFLMEAEGGRYADPLAELLQDAAEGRMYDRVQDKFGRNNRDVLGFYSSRQRPVGSEIFQTYFGDDLDRIGREYQAFIKTLALPRTRITIARGDRPDGIERSLHDQPDHRFFADHGSSRRRHQGDSTSRSESEFTGFATDTDRSHERK
ncbi:MAG: hypothetical protein ACOC0P_05435 [Planctomycetota bacterium]